MTLEDLKSAEQLVKKKQQQENQQRTSELQQLVNNSSSGGVGSTAVGTTATVTAASAASDSTGGGQERRPSWRLKVDPSEKNRVSARITERNVIQKMAMRLEVSPKREGCILFIFFEFARGGKLSLSMWESSLLGVGKGGSDD